MNYEKLWIAVGLVLFAIFGTCVRWINIRDPKERKLISLSAKVFTAVFIGTSMYCFWLWIDTGLPIIFIITGTIGREGSAKGGDYLTRLVKAGIQKIIGVRVEE